MCFIRIRLTITVTLHMNEFEQLVLLSTCYIKYWVITRAMNLLHIESITLYPYYRRETEEEEESDPGRMKRELNLSISCVLKQMPN